MGVTKPRTYQDTENHAKYLLCILPMLKGKPAFDKSRVRTNPRGFKTFELVNRFNDGKKNYGVCLLLKENEHGEYSASIHSVFRLYDNNNLTKSYQLGEAGLQDRQLTPLNHKTQSSNLNSNFIIQNNEKQSMVKNQNITYTDDPQFLEGHQPIYR